MSLKTCKTRKPCKTSKTRNTRNTCKTRKTRNINEYNSIINVITQTNKTPRNVLIKEFNWKLYFPYEKDLEYTKLQMTTIGLYSISNVYLTKEFEYLIKKLIPEYDKKIITDANGGIGGDSILFTKLFKFVNVVELDILHSKVINNNLKIYKRINYTVYNNNVLKLLSKNIIQQDIIYFDPPWGGPEYKKYNVLELYLDKVPFSEIVNNYILSNTIICKLPKNYNIKLLKDIARKYKKKIYIKQIKNVLIIFINF